MLSIILFQLKMLSITELKSYVLKENPLVLIVSVCLVFQIANAILVLKIKTNASVNQY